MPQDVDPAVPLGADVRPVLHSHAGAPSTTAPKRPSRSTQWKHWALSISVSRKSSGSVPISICIPLFMRNNTAQAPPQYK
jgi:hypothetical protein